MACPECGCKVTYQYDPPDDYDAEPSVQERCSACGAVFDADDAEDDD